MSCETDLIFDKSMECPVCGKAFKTKQVKVGKARFLGTETDLRPLYKGIDTIKYDAVVCLNCGYAGMAHDFLSISPTQIRTIRESISKNFQSPGECEGAYSYNMAIQRYKLTLYAAMLKHDKLGSIAYICLKIAWLYRGLRENLNETDMDFVDKVEKLEEFESEYIEKAYHGFVEALEKERPPICGMNDSTLNCLLADLARRCKEYEHAEQFVYLVLTDQAAISKVKDKARMILETIRSDKIEYETGKSDNTEN